MSLAGAQRKRGLVVEGRPGWGARRQRALHPHPQAGAARVPGPHRKRALHPGPRRRRGVARCALHGARSWGRCVCCRSSATTATPSPTVPPSRLHQEGLLPRRWAGSAPTSTSASMARAPSDPTIADMVALVRRTSRPSVQQVDGPAAGDLVQRDRRQRRRPRQELLGALRPRPVDLRNRAAVRLDLRHRLRRGPATWTPAAPRNHSRMNIRRRHPLLATHPRRHRRARPVALNPARLAAPPARHADRQGHTPRSNARIDECMSDPVTAHDIVAASRGRDPSSLCIPERAGAVARAG